MAMFFTSDTHFSDHRTINIHRRPFASVADMDEAVVGNWNAVIEPEDEVWHLGDFARTARIAATILPRLHGQKHLVRGNNDPDETTRIAEWATVHDYHELRVDGVLLSSVTTPFAVGTLNAAPSISTGTAMGG